MGSSPEPPEDGAAVANEFATRIRSCDILPLSSAGVEVSNKLHPWCTVVKGATPRPGPVPRQFTRGHSCL